MGASLLLLLNVAFLYIQFTNGTRNECSRYCEDESSKFGYEVGNSYNYIYEGGIKSTVNATGPDEVNAQSAFLFESEVQISVYSPCNYVMQLSNTKFKEIYTDNKGMDVIRIPDKSEQMKIALHERPLHFAIHNGRIETICPSEVEDDDDILHIKKAILSSFQNSMPDFNGNSVVYETDISGNCETRYKIRRSDTDITIDKNKNLDACSNRRSRHMSWLTVPHSNTLKNSIPLLRSTQRCVQKVNQELILDSTECFEEHLFKPFSNGNNGAVTYLTQHLRFVKKNEFAAKIKLPTNLKRDSLLYNHKLYVEDKSNETTSVLNLLDTINEKNTHGIEIEVLTLFSQLIFELQKLRTNSIIDVFQSVKQSPRKKKFLLDALPLITSEDGINTMQILYQQREVSGSEINSWLGSLIHLKEVSLPIIYAVTPFMTLESVRHKSILSTSSLIYIYCKDKPRCLNEWEIENAVKIIELPLRFGCSPSSPENYKKILLALKGIGNMGLSNSLRYLKSCYSNNDVPMELRLTAIGAHRRINCAENENLEDLENFFADPKQNSEIRIASYLAAMQCASYATFAHVKDVLRSEETNQVGSFVWTHLTNLQESSSRWKENLRNLVENEFIRNKFSTDLRKYSRNYEASIYFDSINAGATLESNVVFTSESYLPKSAMFNFTLDLFGETVNIFEVGARMEGFEQVIESLFGPDGYFPEESIRNALETIRSNGNKSEDKIQQLRNSFTSQTAYKEPTGLLYSKIFGNEIAFAEFKDFEGLIGGPINGRTVLETIMKLVKQQSIDYTKSFVFLDSTYKIPTLLGFPLKLSVNGTSTVGLTVEGIMNLKEIWAHKLVVAGKICPSVVVEVAGSMIIDTGVSKIGLKSTNTLNSNTYVDGHIIIDNGKFVDLKLNAPKKEMNILNIESRVSLIQSDRSYPLNDVAANVEDWKWCTDKAFNVATGTQLCYGVRYVNASMTPSAPYFPLTGKFRYTVNLRKTDTFDNYRFIFNISSEIKNYFPTYSMFVHFDTPNSKINRKIESSYLLDCEKLSFNASLRSPFVNLEVISKIGNDYDNLEFILQTKLNNNEILLGIVSLKSAKIDDIWKYEPSLKINYKSEQVVALSGNVDYIQGNKYNASLKFEWFKNDPVMVFGELNRNSKEFAFNAAIKSAYINGNTLAEIKNTPTHMSIVSKTVYDYMDLKEQVVYFVLIKNTELKETISTENFYLSVNSTQAPLYDSLLSFDIEKRKLHLDVKGIVTLFGETWETREKFKIHKSNGNNEFCFKCSLKCAKKDIDYDIDLTYLKSSHALKVHGLLQLNRTQRVEALFHYNGNDESNRTLDILLYYPQKAFVVKGTMAAKSEKEYNVFIESFYEIAENRNQFLTVIGQYTNSTTSQLQNHTAIGTIEGFGIPWIVTTSLQIAPDLFLHTFQLQGNQMSYVSYLTLAPGGFSVQMQINDEELLTVSGMKNENELIFLIGLNIYQHFELSVNLIVPYKKLELLLYWDKDRDVNQKIYLIVDSYTNKGLYVLDLEYPYQKLVASFILLPEQVTLNVTWGIDSSKRIYLKAGNKVYDIGVIWFAKLETPFRYLNYQEFQLSYYVLPQNSELRTDVSWLNQKISLTISGTKSVNHLSGYLDLNTTIRELSKVSIAVSHSQNITEDVVKIKNDAAIIFNNHQITGQILWNAGSQNISSSFEIVSSSDTIRPITGSLFINNNDSTNSFNGLINWRNEEILVDFKFEKSKSYVKVKTPFKGLEVTEISYVLVAEPDKLLMEIKFNLLTQSNYLFLFWENEEQVNSAKVEMACAMIGTYKMELTHSTSLGRLKEYLLISSGNSNILEASLNGNVVPPLRTNLTGNINFLLRNASIVIQNDRYPAKSVIDIRSNGDRILSILDVNFSDGDDISDISWIVSSNFLEDNIACRYARLDNSYAVSVVLALNYKFENVLILNDSYKSVRNNLNVRTPFYLGNFEYIHVLKTKRFDSGISLNVNGIKSEFALNYDTNNNVDASVILQTPWHPSIILNLMVPQEPIDVWKPSFILKYGDRSVVSLVSFMKLDKLTSKIRITCNSTFSESFTIGVNYNFLRQLKTLQMHYLEKNRGLNIDSQFILENRKGGVVLNVKSRHVAFSKILLDVNLEYDFENTLKTGTFLLSLPPQKHKILLKASSSNENGIRKSDVVFTSSIPKWKKVVISSSIDTVSDQNYIVINKNRQSLTVKYNFKRVYEKESKLYMGHLILLSDFEQIQNFSSELTYKNSNRFQDISVAVSLGDRNARFKGNYEYIEKVNRIERYTSLNGKLVIDYSQQSETETLNIFNVRAEINGSSEINETGGKIAVAFASNVPFLKMTRATARYELLENGYNIEADLNHNDDFYSVEHRLIFVPNKYEFTTKLITPTRWHSRVGKSTYDITIIINYDSILTFDGLVEVITPYKEYKGGLNSNATSEEHVIELYTILDDEFNEAKILWITNDRSIKTQLHADFPSFNLKPVTLQAHYYFSNVETILKAQINSDNETTLELNLNRRNAHINVISPTLTLTIGGNHNFVDTSQFSLSYAIYLNEDKINVDLSHKISNGISTSLDINTTINKWKRFVFRNTLLAEKFELLLDLQNRKIHLNANKKALFKNQALLKIQYNKTPIVVIWSGHEKSYITSSSPLGNYKFTFDYFSDPKIYTIAMLKDGRELLSLVAENIHSETFFDFNARMTNSIFPQYSNLSIYLHTNYEIPNEFRFTLQNHADTILGLMYNFQIQNDHYLAVFYLRSRSQILQTFSVSFVLDPQFLLEFEVAALQFDVEKVFHLTVGLPFESNEIQIKIEFPLYNDHYAFSLTGKDNYLNVYSKTPFKNYEEMFLMADFNNLKRGKLEGTLVVRQNDNYVSGTWHYGYDGDVCFFVLNIEDSLNGKENKFVVNVRYLREKSVEFLLDMDERDIKILFNLFGDRRRLFANSTMMLRDVAVNEPKDVYFEFDFKNFNSLYSALGINDRFVYNFTANYTWVDKVFSCDLDLSIDERFISYNCGIRYDYGNFSRQFINGVYREKIGVNGYDIAMTSQLGLNGNISLTAVETHEIDEVTSKNDYEIIWLLRRNDSNSLAIIKFGKNNYPTYVKFGHDFDNFKLQSFLFVTYGEEGSLRLILEQISNPELIWTHFSLETPLQQLKTLQFETYLKQTDDELKFNNVLVWPENRQLEFNWEVKRKWTKTSMRSSFSSPFGDSVEINLDYNFKEEFWCDAVLLIGGRNFTLKTEIVPLIFATIYVTSPYSGYSSLNLTGVYDYRVRSIKIFLTKESSAIEFIGHVKTSDNEIFLINAIASNSNANIANFFIKIDRHRKNGSAVLMWNGGSATKVNLSYDPENLLLELNLPFLNNQEVRLEGQYVKISNGMHGVKLKGLWNDARVDSETTFTYYGNGNLSIKCDNAIGENHNSSLNFLYRDGVGTGRVIILTTYFGRKENHLDLSFVSEKNESDAKILIILTTPFSYLNHLYVEKNVGIGHVDTKIEAKLSKQEIKSIFKCNYKKFNEMDVHLVVEVPVEKSRWEIEVENNFFERGLLHVGYSVPNDKNEISIDYRLDESKLTTHYVLNGDKDNVTHSLKVYFKNFNDDKQYGIKCDDYKILFKQSNVSFYQLKSLLEANIPYADVNLGLSILVNTLDSSVLGRLWYDIYDIDVQVENSLSAILATAVVKLEQEIYSRMHTTIETSKTGITLKHDVYDNLGMWFNTTITYLNTKEAAMFKIWMKYTLFEPFVASVDIEKSLERMHFVISQFFELKLDRLPVSSKFYLLMFDNHLIYANFENSDFNLHVRSVAFDTDDLKLILKWSFENNRKRLNFSCVQKYMANLTGSLSFELDENKEYRLTVDVSYYDEKVLDFLGKISLDEVIRGSLALNMLSKNNEAYFVINLFDPYMAGITVASSFLPYDGFTFQTSTSIDSSFIFIFAGTGCSKFLKLDLINETMHDKYVYFQAKKENKGVFVRYEAPDISWLSFVHLQGELDIRRNVLRAHEIFEVKSDFTDNFAINTEIDIAQRNLRANVRFLVPFILVFPKFIAELNIPFELSNDFNPKFVMEFPNANYSTHLRYKRNVDNFFVSLGYQYENNNFDLILNVSDNQLPVIFLNGNLPFVPYNRFKFSFAKENQSILCDLNVLNEHYKLNYALIYSNYRYMFHIALITPIQSYEKLSLNLEYRNDENLLLKGLIFVPSFKKEYGVLLDLDYRNVLEKFKFSSKISLPTEMKTFGYGEFFILHNLNYSDVNKSYVFVSNTKIDNFNLTLTLNTSLNSDLLLFNFDTRVGNHKFFAHVKSLGDVYNNLSVLFDIRTSYKNMRNFKTFLDFSNNLENGLHAAIIYNSKTFSQLNFTVTNNKGYIKFHNIWRPVLIEYEYHNSNRLVILGKFSWDLDHLEQSQIGGHLIINRNVSFAAIFPNRIITIDINKFVDKHHRHYFGGVSWSKHRKLAVTFASVNFTTAKNIYLKKSAIVTLPFKIFEITQIFEASIGKYPCIKTNFTFKWDKNDTSMLFFQNHVLPNKYESRLFIPALEDQVVLVIDLSSLHNNPSRLTTTLEYSPDPNKRFELEIYSYKHSANIFKMERRFLLRHVASKIDYSLHFAVLRTPKYTLSNVTLQYTNYEYNRSEQMEGFLKIAHEKLNVIGNIRTSKNHLHILGISRTGRCFQGLLMKMQVNRKDPLTMESIYNFRPTGSSLSLTASYGKDRRYDFYTGFPSKREILTKLSHDVYGKETIDGLFTFKLNSSQILWFKLYWKNELLSQFRSTILEEYEDLRYIIESIGKQFVDVVEDDLGQMFFRDILEMRRNISSFGKQQIKYVSASYDEFLNDFEQAYLANEFYCRDIEELLRKIFPNFGILNGILDPLRTIFVQLYETVSNVINDTVICLRNLLPAFDEQIINSLNRLLNIKEIKSYAKEMLKNDIKEVRASLKRFDAKLVELMDSIDEYVVSIKEQCEEFFEPYLKILDDFIIYVEQRLAILQILILDILDTVQHYIINLRESKEALKLYALYLNWFEELHLIDILEPIGDAVEMVLNKILADIKNVLDNYRPYVDAISEAIFGNYRNINKLPPLTEFRKQFSTIYQRAVWIWDYHNISVTIQNYGHKFISDFDNYLASLIKLDDNAGDFENVLGQSDYVFRPDLGIIEITQPLPVEWEAFDEMPYFEQHPLYDRIKKRTESLIQLQRRQFLTIINTVKNYVGESSNTLLSPSTNNIGMIVGKSNYITFDKKYYVFAGECGYLLASDFVTKTFSVLINYCTDNGLIKKKSISVISGESNLEISPDFRIVLNNVENDLPIVSESLMVTRDFSEVSVENGKGLKVTCNLYYDYCTVKLSGWLFGKTGGLLGTLDNEKTTDMNLPHGDRASNILEFVQSWQVGAQNCSNVNHANDLIKENISPLSITLFETLCQVFFVNVNSPFEQCFEFVDTKPFYDMCVNNMKDKINPTICSSVAAYRAQCQNINVQIEIPEMCIHCKYGIGLNEDIFDRIDLKSIDVVIIKETSCYRDIDDLSYFPNDINVALINKDYKDNQFAIVGYGENINKPYIYTSGNQIWTTGDETAINAKPASNNNGHYVVPAIDAIKFASNLEFRPGVSKLFILMQCEYYTELKNLDDLQIMFGEKDITLHVLKKKLFNRKSMGLNNTGNILYMRKDFDVEIESIKAMNATIIRGVPEQMSDIYNLLALSTNGTVLSIDDRIKREGGLIPTSWSELISETAKRIPCQRCKCITNIDGTGRVDCKRCMSPIIKQLLNEYESSVIEFNTEYQNDDNIP